jgi:ADP-heptose:LPS heptosyltransferase
MATVQRIAVLRALHLGDLLCAIPALRAIRVAVPGAQITLIGLADAAELTAHFGHHIDELLCLPGWPGLPEQAVRVDAVPEFLRTAQSRCFDLAIQLHGNGSVTNSLLMLLGARRNAGFFSAPAPPPDAAGFLPYPEAEHEIVRLLRLTEHLGFASVGTELEFPVSAQHRAELADTLDVSRRPYVCLHPGARDHARRWPPLAFAAVADGLAADGYRIVITGTRRESAVTRAVREAMRAPALDLTGRLSLGALGALLGSARLLVCNDTGVSHIAAALRTRSVVMFGASDPARWAPLDHGRHHALERPSPAQVLAHAHALLASEAVGV